MRYGLTILLIVVFAPFCFAQQNNIDAAKLAGIDSLMNVVLKEQPIAGFAIAVVKGNDVIYSKGFGYRDVANKKPVTTNTLFAIGSSSKAFTSGLLGQLRKEGKVSFDVKATNYLPELKFYNDDMNQHITIRDMMCHRTGLSRYETAWYTFNTPKRDELLARIQYMQPTAQLREKWQYNNFMFLLQGMITEKITGKTWEQNIQERFFDPLDMKRSNTDIEAMKRDTNASLPYIVLQDSVITPTPYYDISGMAPAGSINSCVADMANWLKLWLNDGKYNNKEILPADYINEATSAQMVMNGGKPNGSNDIHFASYGLGWMLFSYRGHYRVQHGGNIDGFSANVVFFPTDKIGIVVLTNQNQSPLTGVIPNLIADRLLNLPQKDWLSDVIKPYKEQLKKKASEKKQPAPKKQPVAFKPSHPLKDYTGYYSNPAYGTIEIMLLNNALEAHTSSAKFSLTHFNYEIFNIALIGSPQTEDNNKVRINFITGIDGKPESLNVYLPNEDKPVNFGYKPKAATVAGNLLEQYTGEYEIGGMVIKAHLKGDVLYLDVPGQQDYETIALGEHQFKLTALNGYSVKFEVSDKAKATALTLIQPNGTFKAPRKK